MDRRVEKGWFKGSKPAGFIFFLQSAATILTIYESSDTRKQARQAFEIESSARSGGCWPGACRESGACLHDLNNAYRFTRLMEYFPKDPRARIAIQVAEVNAQPGRIAHFALDVIALDPKA